MDVARSKLYFADVSNRRVRVVDLSSGVIRTVAGGGTISGDASDIGDGRPATSAVFSTHPMRVMVDDDDALFVTDAHQNRVRRVDPVTQVIDTLEKAIAAGGITRTDGAHMSFERVARRSAFIIADLTPSLIKVLKRHNFQNPHDPKIWTQYFDNGEIFIQAFGYDTLVSMAKKRNQAFSKVLLDD